MPDYFYLDSNYKYIDAQTGVLFNKLGITDADHLAIVEHEITSASIVELRLSNFKIENAESILEIHRRIFADVYEWAGKLRTVEIAKGDSQFSFTSDFEVEFATLNLQIIEYRQLSNESFNAIIESLATILNKLNQLHPFREGNGRVQREFIHFLAEEKNLCVDLSNSENVADKYLVGTIYGDIAKLTEAIKLSIQSAI